MDNSGTRNFRPLDQNRNCLMGLAIVNHKDCHFKFQNLSENYTRCKVYKRSEWNVFKVSHRLSQLCSLLNLEWLIHFQQVVQFHCYTFLNNKPCHIALTYRCLIKKCDHISPTHLYCKMQKGNRVLNQTSTATANCCAIFPSPVPSSLICLIQPNLNY